MEVSIKMSDQKPLRASRAGRTILVVIPPDLRARLYRHAADNDLSVSQVVRAAIRLYLSRRAAQRA
jgi:hypothetical protein